jgi:hypothetical protein
MAAKQKTYTIHHLVILFFMALPALYAWVKYAGRESKEDTSYNKPDLVGLVISDDKPKFGIKEWLSGEYQQLSDDYDNDHWSMKESMVRLNNQFYYKAFNQIRVNNFVIGKNDYVFSEGYIFSAFGDDLVKESKVQDLLGKAKVVQDSLKKKGIDLLLVYAPGKGMGCREFVEDKYIHPYTKTNHDLFAANSKQLGLNYLDLYAYFEQLKDMSPYPLFPKFGHHWSYYGECLAVDTIVKHIRQLHHCAMPGISWQSVEVVDTARSRDADVLKSMNLYSNPEQGMKLAYPQILFDTDSSQNPVKVLTVSDSYWYGPVYMGVGQNCFGGGQFWYYYNKVIPSPIQGQKVEVWELDLKKEVESNGVIMVLYSDGNLSGFGNNFIPDLYEMYTSPKTFEQRYAKYKQMQALAKEIRESPVLLKKATQESKDRGISLDSAIRREAAVKMLN